MSQRPDDVQPTAAATPWNRPGPRALRLGRATAFRIALAVLAVATPTSAQVTGVDLTTRAPFADGRRFADVGTYEDLRGTIHFALDPANPRNAAIVDLDRAPRNADGLVTCSADLRVLQPTDPAKRSGTALLEVSNRGGMASLRHFQIGGRGGDALLMERGYTIIWVGWQWDVGRGLRLDAPRAAGTDGGPITGLVRADWVVDSPTDTLRLGHGDHRGYRPVDVAHADNVLTERDGRDAERRVVPRERWAFVLGEDAEITLEGGFMPGRIYELVYRAADPYIVGLGLAAVRDTMSYAKYDPACPFPVERGIGTGISQTGRFLRHFLYQGFNADTEDRMVFDGVLAQVAGAGRGSFNHRFGQASRDAHRYRAFVYPTDIYPFASRPQRDDATGQEAGLLDRQLEVGHTPKLFQVNTGYEYWGRAASLIHTTLDGSADLAPHPLERIYHLASAQHYVGRAPRPKDVDAQAAGATTAPTTYPSNPLNWRLPIRALLVAMDEWVTDGTEPPASAYPRIADETLVPVADVAFPAIRGVRFPAVVHTAYRADYGPHWADGIVTHQPPRLDGTFATLVPQVDAFGNEAAGIRGVEVLAPLATYTPWGLRPDGELRNFTGNFIPLPRTEAERLRWNDPRPSLEATFGTRENYMAKARSAAQSLASQRFLLERDVERAVRAAGAAWDLVLRARSSHQK